MREMEIKDALRKCLGLRNGEGVAGVRRVEEQRKEDFVLAYRMQLASGAVVDLGTAAEVLKFSKCQAAFAESCGHVIPSKESKNWDTAAQLIFDLYRIAGGEDLKIPEEGDANDEKQLEFPVHEPKNMGDLPE